ncbi:hypothetical protein D3C87_2106330 [compost metagenome]
MPVAFSSKHQRKNQSFGAQIHRRNLLTKLRLILMGGAHFIFVFVPQHRARNGAAAGE